MDFPDGLVYSTEASKANASTYKSHSESSSPSEGESKSTSPCPSEAAITLPNLRSQHYDWTPLLRILRGCHQH